MSIIESIKNGARFRHKDGTNPYDWYVLKNGHLVVWWGKESYHPSCNYSQEGITLHIELIPEEETLWVAVSKSNHPAYPNCYSSTHSYITEQEANEASFLMFGPGNYTIHSITRTK